MTAATPLARAIRDLAVRVEPGMSVEAAFNITAELMKVVAEVERLEKAAG